LFEDADKTATSSGPALVFVKTVSQCPDPVRRHENLVAVKGQRASVLVSAPASLGAFHHASDSNVLPRKEDFFLPQTGYPNLRSFRVPCFW
jgi:hypothetical protein